MRIKMRHFSVSDIESLFDNPQNLAKIAIERYCNFEHFYTTFDAKTGINQTKTNI